jgi:hypothetical protein
LRLFGVLMKGPPGMLAAVASTAQSVGVVAVGGAPEIAA